VKARRVKGLEPLAPLADNAARIVRVRLEELCAFMPTANDPEEVTALHDMRIAAKRLRYILEVTAPCFGPYAETAVDMVKDLQDLLGEIHDCDVQTPEVMAFLAGVMRDDAQALTEGAGKAPDLSAKALRTAPGRHGYAGLAGLGVHLQARRDLLFERFREMWLEYERKGFRARLEFAVAERPQR
jgi:hypothetical protein